MLRVVLDSNIYVSALIFGGNPRRVIEAVQMGFFELAISPPIQAEVERILAMKFAWPQHRIETIAAHVWSLAQLATPTSTVADCPDNDDNRILECALAAEASYIITGDNHLLKRHPFRGIQILTARQFLDGKSWLPAP